MKKFFYFAAVLILTAGSSAPAYEYKLYNPDTKEFLNASMMSIGTGKGSSYYIGFYTYNLYCAAGKKIHTSIRNRKSGVCYPIDTHGNVLRTTKLPRWKEVSPGTYDLERGRIAEEYSEQNLKMNEVPFPF